MNKVLKSTLGVAAAAAIVGANVVASVNTLAYGDNSGRAGYRQEYTTQQINDGALGKKGESNQKIVLNSITDNPYGNEFNFVAARVDDGSANGVNNKLSGNTIAAEDGKTYWISMYVHNNNPNGTEAIAKGVTVNYTVPGNTANKVTVGGVVKSSNAYPTEYWDTVDFTSTHAFHLEYVAGSGILQNNGIGARSTTTIEGKTYKGAKLSDAIVSNGVLIGYDSLNGEVPGCYTYANWVGIKVKVVYDDVVTPSFTVDKKVRAAGTKDKFVEEMEAKVGDKVQYQIDFHNTGSETVKNVTVKDVLPNNAKLVSGSIKLYNSSNPNGLVRSDAELSTGINMGTYEKDSHGYLRFTVEIVDKSLACGKNRLMNWGLVGVAGTTVKDNADVLVTKECKDTPTDNNQTTEDSGNVATVSTLPSTGPAAIATSVIGAGSVVTTAGYYVASRKKLNK